MPTDPLDPTPTGIPFDPAIRRRPLLQRRADPDDPLCANPLCSIESWDWHRCQVSWRKPRV